MGLSLGGSTGGTSESKTGTASSTATPTYSGDQTGLQALLSKVFSSLLPATADGGISPNVQAVQTAGADEINKTSSGLGDRMNRFLAQRGFGKSGATGKAALQTEIGRESALGANASAASGLQLGQNSTALSDALGFAFANPGGTKTGTTSETGDTSGWGTSAGASFSLGKLLGLG